jgi:predicted DNA-binding protein
MPKAINDNRKRKRGRPATGTDPLVGVRMSTELTKAVDQWAKKNGHTRASAIRHFVEQGLSNLKVR